MDEKEILAMLRQRMEAYRGSVSSLGIIREEYRNIENPGIKLKLTWN